MNRTQEIENTIIKRYRSKIWAKFVKAINEFELVSDGDKIAVCISGGKDSMLLAKCFEELKRHGKINFEIVNIVMDPGYAKENMNKIKENLDILGIDAHIFKSNIFDVADNNNKRPKDNPCYLCARMRRGHLYNEAKKLGCNKIALGHHMDDVIETVLLNMIYTGQFSSMIPKLHSDNFEGMELIRPLYYVKEDNIRAWATYNNLSFIDCACSVTKKGLGSRKVIKELVNELKDIYSEADKNILSSTKNVNLNTVISYKLDGNKYNFLDEYWKK